MAAGRRADAQRNYERLLAAAAEVFGERGAGAPLDEIARRAGIGNATMYRHFPTRSDLLIAVYADEVAALCARGAALLDASDAGAALFEWLEAFIGHVAGKRELAHAIPADSGTPRSELFRRWHGSMHETAGALVERAQHAGAVRLGVTAADLLALANGIALAAADAGQARRLLALARQGTEALRQGSVG
jgi:AcrR family transcriptional regulator